MVNKHKYIQRGKLKIKIWNYVVDESVSDINIFIIGMPEKNPDSEKEIVDENYTESIIMRHFLSNGKNCAVFNWSAYDKQNEEYERFYLDYLVEEMHAAIKEIISNSDIQNINLIATSFGCLLTTLFLQKYGDIRFNKIIFNGPVLTRSVGSLKYKMRIDGTTINRIVKSSGDLDISKILIDDYSRYDDISKLKIKKYKKSVLLLFGGNEHSPTKETFKDFAKMNKFLIKEYENCGHLILKDENGGKEVYQNRVANILNDIDNFLFK